LRFILVSILSVLESIGINPLTTKTVDFKLCFCSWISGI